MMLHRAVLMEIRKSSLMLTRFS